MGAEEKIILASLTLAELTTELTAVGLPRYRAAQVYANLQKYQSFAEMTDLPKDLRRQLAERYIDRPAAIVRRLDSKDGTAKYLLELADGELVECVLLRQSYGDTLCVSCQSGCRMGCKFCASGLSGLKRNLTAGEILSQVLCVNADKHSTMQGGRSITNLVMMGCGEPFDNYDNTVRFLRLVSAPEGLHFSLRNISVSTCGLADRVCRFAEEGLPVTLCFSMHSPFDERRATIMPIERRHSIAEVLDAFSLYFVRTKRRFIIEYTVIAGFNDREEDAAELKRLLAGRVCHVNLIPLNRVEESSLAGGRADAERFLRKLLKRRLSATIRMSAGDDIDGACGQLRRRVQREREEVRAENRIAGSSCVETVYTDGSGVKIDCVETGCTESCGIKTDCVETGRTDSNDVETAGVETGCTEGGGVKTCCTERNCTAVSSTGHDRGGRRDG